MRFTLALLVGKLLAKLGGLLGKATNLPGQVALKICPDLMARIRFNGKVLAVTGSNGKTTTANLVAHILTQNGYSVAGNAKGSNLTGGVATTLLCASDLHGRARQDFIVLEVDERYSRLIFRWFSPDYLLVTNLFRDQLTRNGNVDVIVDKLHQAIGPDVQLVLNSCDPISGDLAPHNSRVYYGLAKTPLSTDESPNLTHDARVCPRCLGRMQYSYYHYNHIGQYRCPSCGYQSPKPQYLATDFDPATGDFAVGGQRVHTSYPSLFHVLNITGAIALCCSVGLPLDRAAAAASTFAVSKERLETFAVGDRQATMILSKNQNPVSFDQSISYLLERDCPGGKTAIILVNNINHTGHKDTTWLYDISFERLVGQVEQVVCTGSRALDLAVRLQVAGLRPDQVRIQPEVRQLVPVVADTTGDLFILTEIYDAHSILEVICP